MYDLWYVIVVRKILMWSHNVTRHYIVKKQLDRVPGINHCKSCRKVADLRITCMSRWVLWSPTTILEDFSECVRHQKQLKFDHVLFMYPCKARCQPDLQNLAEKRLHFFVPCVGLCPKKKEGGEGTKLDPLMNCEKARQRVAKKACLIEFLRVVWRYKILSKLCVVFPLHDPLPPAFPMWLLNSSWLRSAATCRKFADKDRPLHHARKVPEWKSCQRVQSVIAPW